MSHLKVASIAIRPRQNTHETLVTARMREKSVIAKTHPARMRRGRTNSSTSITAPRTKGPFKWDGLTNRHIRPKELIRFIARKGIIWTRYIEDDENARDAGYAVGESI
ncbi:hypothetical protein Q9L58_010243 [Maublancomyces gigas]|uniref:Uncharacterized protein n=1 Tax=Discina gigas TaxID=1032678 RepID=A0ABR3G4M6_9PEZI